MEQDRARLIPVAERLVKLGADVAAHDMEGRTALHLAAGCGDKTMVVRLVALGVDVNCKDSVGGQCITAATLLLLLHALGSLLFIPTVICKKVQEVSVTLWCSFVPRLYFWLLGLSAARAMLKR